MKQPCLVALSALLMTLSPLADTPLTIEVPLGLPPLPEVDVTAEKVELGKKLFYDKSFSFSGKTRCQDRKDSNERRRPPATDKGRYRTLA